MSPLLKEVGSDGNLCVYYINKKLKKVWDCEQKVQFKQNFREQNKGSVQAIAIVTLEKYFALNQSCDL